jgi:hypothetical protein
LRPQVPLFGVYTKWDSVSNDAFRGVGLHRVAGIYYWAGMQSETLPSSFLAGWRATPGNATTLRCLAVASQTFYNLVDRHRKAVAWTRTNVAGYDSALGTQADSIFADDLPTGAADRNNLTFALVNRETDPFSARHVSLNPPCASRRA